MPRIERYTETKTEFRLEDGARPPLVPGDFETMLLDGKPEAVRFLCPCGCGSEVFLYLVTSERGRGNLRPLWDYRSGGNLINPSVHHLDGCKSHYFIREDGTVQWA